MEDIVSATPPFGPAYNQPPDDGRRQGSNQWQPRAGRPESGRGARCLPGREARCRRRAAGPVRRPVAALTASGLRLRRSPHRGPGRAPAAAASAAAATAAPPYGHQSPPSPAPPSPDRASEPFEEAAFADDTGQGDWGDGQETTAIGRLGEASKVSRSRRRSDFQKKRSRARKSGPIPKIIAVVVVLGLLGGAGWWWFNRDDSTGGGDEAADPNLEFAASEEPCGFADTAPMADYVDGEPESNAETRDRQRGWEQVCSLTYGSPESSTALLEFESTVFESDAVAEVNFDLGYSRVSESEETWAVVDSAPVSVTSRRRSRGSSTRALRITSCTSRMATCI
ncbi:hypothetical protein GCM10029992_24000 [Glycomyces albus]